MAYFTGTIKDPFHCAKCSATFLARIPTLKHVHKMHSESGQQGKQMVYCNVCQKAIRLNGFDENHVLMHSVVISVRRDMYEHVS